MSTSVSFFAILLGSLAIAYQIALVASASSFHGSVDISWGHHRAQIQNNGEILSLSLDNYSGSGFQSKQEYLFGRIDLQIKLIPGNSAGTVSTFFLSSLGNEHDEVDFEFLGNATGHPYTVHTNVYSRGKGDKEQQFYLWFDPTSSFHTYSIAWDSKRIIFLVDNIPLRVYNNREDIGVPYPKTKPMKVYCSLWNADDWATQGGLVKTDWSHAPFTTYYRNFNANACVWHSTAPCNQWKTHELTANDRKRMKWVQTKYMIYNYCRDNKRFPHGLPAECKKSKSKA